MLSPRLAALASTCGVLLMAGTAPAGASPMAPSGGLITVEATTEEIVTAPAVVATYNIRHGLSAAVAISDIEMLSVGVGVIGLQEMGSRDRRVAVREQLVDCSACQFDAFMPDG
ncbi:MAG: hypothetical protein M3R09_01090, partial [Actinomycetota bacterium]|nr:hypothetical protein [Actinomycetota bacterium]